MWTSRKSRRGCMLSLSWNILAERCLLRNSTPFPIDFERVGRGNDAVKGSKSNSRTKFPLHLHPQQEATNIVNKYANSFQETTNSCRVSTYGPFTSSSMNCRYLGTLNSSTTRALRLTHMYSHTPGLSQTAKATHGGKTIVSCHTQN